VQCFPRTLRLGHCARIRDLTYAFTGVLGHFNWRVQYERDAPLDKSGLKQIYSDVLATYRIKTKKIGPSGGASLCRALRPEYLS